MFECKQWCVLAWSFHRDQTVVSKRYHFYYSNMLGKVNVGEVRRGSTDERGLRGMRHRYSIRVQSAPIRVHLCQNIFRMTQFL